MSRSKEREAFPHMVRMAGLVAALVAIGACGGAADDSAQNPESTQASTSSVATSVAAGSSTTPPVDTEPPEEETTTEASSTVATTKATTTIATEPPLTADGNAYSIVWDAVTSPFWAPANDADADPFFFIHTSPEVDGFYFALEMYTTGYGGLWEGELGDVAIICDEAAPAPNSTGICPHFDPDGPGPLGDLNADFAATGSITITQLDSGGYDIAVNELVFSDGSVIQPFALSGP